MVLVPAEPYTFTDEDRREQLRALLAACAESARLLRLHGETWHADMLIDRADEAERLLAKGFTRQDLNRVAGQFPTGPDWTDPRAVDYGAPRQPWQDRVAHLLIAAQRAAQDLRATATYLR